MRYRLVAVSQEHPEGGSLTVERKSSEPRLNFAASTGEVCGHFSPEVVLQRRIPNNIMHCRISNNVTRNNCGVMHNSVVELTSLESGLLSAGIGSL